MLKICKWKEKEGNEYINDGLIRVNPEKPEFGSIMVQSSPVVSIGTGFLNVNRRFAFFPGKITDLESLELSEGASFDEIVGQDLKIIRLESTVEIPGFQKLINPKTNQEICNLEGELIYWKHEIVLKSSEKVDEVIDKIKPVVSRVTEKIAQQAFQEQ